MKKKNAGFTLAELMVVVLIAGTVFLLFPQIPLFSVSSWRKGTDRLRMQRDVHYAMIKVQHELKPASFTGSPLVSVGDYVVADDNYRKLGINGDWFYVDQDDTSSFFNDLVKESGGNKEQIIEGDAGTDFRVRSTGKSIKIVLTLLRDNVGNVVLRTAVKPRN